MKERVLYFDVLKILATIAVVTIHVSSEVANHYELYPSAIWWPANLINAGSRWAVPIFVMVSGALLLKPPQAELTKKSLTVFFRKRAFRLGLPLIFWTAIYAIAHHFWRGDPLELGYIFNRIIFDQPYEHLYFIYILLELALFTPLLWLWIKKATRRQQQFLLFTLLLLTVIWPENRFVGSLAIPYISYYLIGYYLHQSGQVSSSAVLALVAIWLGIAWGNFGVHQGWFNSLPGDFFYNYLKPPVLLLSMLVFYVVRLAEKSGVFSQAKQSLIKFSNLSYGVYLSHYLVLLFLQKTLGLNSLSNTSFAGMIAVVAICLGASAVITSVFRALPGLKNVV